jgi:hypothetical protein
LIKQNLNQHGKKSSAFNPADHVTDSPSIFILASETQDVSVQRKYRTLGISLIVTLVAFVTIASMMFESTSDVRCRRYAEYVNYRVSGTVTGKFVDKPNHALETLSMELSGQAFEENELPLFVNGLYDTLRVGDIVSKEKGTPDVIITLLNDTIVLTANSMAFCNP